MADRTDAGLEDVIMALDSSLLDGPAPNHT